MTHKTLPDAVARFISGVMQGDTGEAMRGLALSVVGIEDAARYRGSDGIRELLEQSPVFEPGGAWGVDFAMDTEAVLSSPRGDRVQFLLDCGRISYVRVFQPEFIAA